MDRPLCLLPLRRRLRMRTMDKQTWIAVDAYLASCLLPPDADLSATLAACREAGLPAIQVSPMQGRLLSMLCRLVSARRVLEVGTLGGYSTIWLARGLSAGGRIVTLEIDPAHAAIARANFIRARLDGVIDLHEGPAADSLECLAGRHGPDFDLVFIDADKPSNPVYLDWAVRLTRPGGVIVIDNVIRGGRVVNDDDDDPSVQGVRRMNLMIRDDPRLTATTLQTVGDKGYDGLTIAIRA